MSNTQISESARSLANRLESENGVSIRIGNCDNPTSERDREHVAELIQSAIDEATEYQSGVSGLWYRKLDAAGDISAIRVNGKTFPVYPASAIGDELSSLRSEVERLKKELESKSGRADRIVADMLENHLPRVKDGCEKGYPDENQILVLYDHAVRARIMMEGGKENPFEKAILDEEPNLAKEGVENIWGYFVHWNEVIARCNSAWKAPRGYSQSPLELISEIINERDSLKSALREAVGFLERIDTCGDSTEHKIAREGLSTLKPLLEDKSNV